MTDERVKNTMAFARKSHLMKIKRKFSELKASEPPSKEREGAGLRRLCESDWALQ